MKPLILALFISFIWINTLSAYPISPRPLRKLMQESEYIVSGHVLEIITVKGKKKDDFESYSVARVKIYDVIKGSIHEEIIEIPYPAYICPAPPRYRADTDVLIFLNKEKKNYRTTALSYGLKTLSLMDIAVYKQRIQEMQHIQLVEDKDQQFIQTVEWLVKCAEHPATRWEGTFELSPSSDFMSYYSREKSEPFQYILSAEQKQRLKQALLSTEDPQYCNFALVDLVYPGNEAEIRSFLLKGLKHLQANRLWLAQSYMTRLLYTKDSPEMKALVDDFSDILFETDKQKQLQSIVSEFLVLAEL